MKRAIPQSFVLQNCIALTKAVAGWSSQANADGTSAAARDMQLVLEGRWAVHLEKVFGSRSRGGAPESYGRSDGLGVRTSLFADQMASLSGME